MLGLVTEASAVQYVVNGWVLGARIARDSASYRAYACKPSEDFENYTYCERTERRNTSLGQGRLSSAILRGEDGTAIYLMADLAPVNLDRQAIEKEINQVSRELDQRPTKVEWLPRGNGALTAVIATWGRVTLESIKIDPADRDRIKIEKDIGPGPLVDDLGDPVRSAKEGLPVYRISGGAGYVYSASFDESGRGHRHYAAADVAEPAIKVFVPALREVLEKDRSLATNDYSLWPDVANATRTLSLASSPEIANEELDKVFAEFPSKKLHSHVWSLLPLGTINSLAAHVHWEASTYGPKTGYPEIRDDITQYLAAHPAEPFSEFLYYTIGEYDKALAANPNSVIVSAIRYGIGYKMLAALLQDAAKAVKIPPPDFSRPVNAGDEPVNDTLVTLNQRPELYGRQLLSAVVPDFAARATAVQPWFDAVLRDGSTPQQDDAAYLLGWLAFQQGKFKKALAYFGQAMTLGNKDYQLPAAVRETIRLMSRFSPREQADIVSANPAFAQQPSLWYVAARSAYQQFDFDLAIATGLQGLKALKIAPDLLPATTDPEMIKQAVEKSLPKEVLTGDQAFDEVDLLEIPYIVEASQEFLQYDNFLKSVDAAQADDVAKRARQIVFKYSLLVDRPEHPAGADSGLKPMHRDLRQAVRLIDVTLGAIPKSPQYSSLRQWLYYRKVRILTQYAPSRVANTVAAMEREFPKSDLLNDALAEQIYAEGAMLKDVPAAERTFQKLLKEFPDGNAVDNAYSWMAIIYRCAHKADLAKKTNMEIIGRFPLTRHAKYAAERLLHPDECKLTAWNSGN
jgi:tetratricopeptide (TPR) repeat protein